MKMEIGRRVENQVRLLGRAVQVVLTAAIVLAGSAQPASAQLIEIMEWIDKMSGPGPFDLDPIFLPSISVPIGCVSRVTTKQGATIQAVRDAYAQRVATPTRGVPPDPLNPWNTLRLEPEINRYRLELSGCFGVVAAANSLADATSPPWGTVDGTPDGLAVLDKRQVVRVEVNVAHLGSRRNDVPGYSAALTDDQKEVKLFRYGLGIRFLPHPSSYVRLSWERNHFYSSSDLFESFDRDTRTIEVGAKPLWASRYKLVQPFTVSAGIKSGLGRFTAADFGARGPYTADDDIKPVFKIGYDIWIDGCWLGAC